MRVFTKTKPRKKPCNAVGVSCVSIPSKFTKKVLLTIGLYTKSNTKSRNNNTVGPR